MGRHKPFTLKIELVKGCTMRCPFCALPNMPWTKNKEPWEFMDSMLFTSLIDDLSEWHPKARIEFAQRGEPSFHPHFIEFVAYARRRMPKVQMLLTSNGDMVNKQKENYPAWLQAAFDAGLNIAMLDCYTVERYQMMRDMLPQAKLFFEEKTHPYGYHGPDFKQIILVDANPGNANAIRWYHNVAGNVDAAYATSKGFPMQAVTEPLQKMCVRPFRELVIHVDGSMPICCQDWQHDYEVGIFPNNSLAELWDMLDPARRLLIQKDRASLDPCSRCSDRAGFRVGLEMDWFGDKAKKNIMELEHVSV